MLLAAGQEAPEFSLPDQNGVTRRLSEYRGKWVVLYFYPKDDTPGCTTEACSMRDNLPHFNQIEAVVLGVSVDSVKSHKKFVEKYQLPFTLLADEQKLVVKRYGVWAEKSFMGKKYMGTERTTYLLNPVGIIEKVYEKVNPETHIEELIADLATLQS